MLCPPPLPRMANRCVLALGSNLGNRTANIHAALGLLRTAVGARVGRTSLLYDTAPQYVTDQPRFLNAACEVTTALPPHELLAAVKGVEQELGRQLGPDGGPRFGPRPIDIDLLLYYPEASPDGPSLALATELLTLPHPRLAERAFVLQPLADLDPTRLLLGPGGDTTTIAQALAALGAAERAELRCVTPLPTAGADACFEWGTRTYLMGVVNMTPDSFSDGGAFEGAAAAVEYGLQLARAGADVVDVGGHSTKPGFATLSEQEELQRVAEVVSSLRAASDAGMAGTDAGLSASLQAGSGVGGRVAISVDTFRPSVAAAAVAAGADIINDVSGGLYCDGEMFCVAAELGVPLVITEHGTDPIGLHTPHEGQSDTPDAIVGVVGQSLARMVRRAEEANMARWQLIIDPGLGFAKATTEENLTLLRNLPEVQATAGGLPLLLGPSRKRFTGEATWHSRVESTAASFDARDFATAGFCAAAVAGGGVDVVRVHNVGAAGDAVRAADMLLRGTHGGKA